jgi:hypothetical protein
MGRVAIRAFHQSFGNPVVNRKRELAANNGVTGVTEIGLRRL